MARAPKFVHKSDFRMAKRGSTPAGIRRVAAAFKRRDTEAVRSIRSLSRELDALRSDYLARRLTLIGRDGSRELNAIAGARLNRAQKLRRAFLKKALALMGRPLPAIKHPHDDACAASPVTMYTPPYGGWYWTLFSDRTPNFREPVVDRYLDTSNGRLGSSITTKILEAGDDDDLYVEYRTGFMFTHTPQIDGVLDVTLTFKFPSFVMSGQVRDEWYASSAMHQQYVRAQLRVTDVQWPSVFEAREYRIGGVAGYSDGDNASWPPTTIISAAETRTYQFTTGTMFRQGAPVAIEAGITHVTMLAMDDMHGTTDADVDMRLTGITVRSCPPTIVL